MPAGSMAGVWAAAAIGIVAIIAVGFIVSVRRAARARKRSERTLTMPTALEIELLKQEQQKLNDARAAAAAENTGSTSDASEPLDAPAAPPVISASASTALADEVGETAAKLRKLTELRAQNLITDEELATARVKLLVD